MNMNERKQVAQALFRYLEHPGENSRLVRSDADAASREPCKAHDNILRKILVHF